MSDQAVRSFVDGLLAVEPEARITDVMGQWVAHQGRQPTPVEANELMAAFARRTGRQVDGMHDRRDAIAGALLVGLSQVVSAPVVWQAITTSMDPTIALQQVIGSALGTAFTVASVAAVVAVVLRRFAVLVGLLLGFMLVAVMWVFVAILTPITSVAPNAAVRP